jgi:hypothetical protein
MIVIRVLAWLFLLATLVAAGAELIASLQAGTWTPLTAGELWFKTHVYSLNLAQALIQRYVHPAIWDPGIVTVLLWPAWLVALIPALVLMLIGRRKPADRRRRIYRK